MAFQFKITAAEGSTCSTIVVTDATGLYNASTNPTGYGTPNPNATDCTACTIVFTPPNGDAYSSLNLVTLGSFPASGSDVTIDYADDLGGSGMVPSGVWTAAVTTTFTNGSGEPITATYTTYFNVQCSNDCCIKGLANDIEAGCCDNCKDEASEKFMKAYKLQLAIGYAYDCAEYERANSLQEELDAICDDTDCGCGG